MHWFVTLWGKVEVERQFIFEFEGGAVEAQPGRLDKLINLRALVTFLIFRKEFQRYRS
jgi:hypothetical protein